MQAFIGFVAGLVGAWIFARARRRRLARATGRRPESSIESGDGLRVDVRILTWRPSDDASLRDSPGRIALGPPAQRPKEFFDETLCLWEWVPRGAGERAIRIAPPDRGSALLEPLPSQPPEFRPSEERPAECGSFASAWMRASPETPARYATRHFNAFQTPEQRLIFPPYANEARAIEVVLDFTSVLQNGAAAFRRLPRARLLSEDEPAGEKPLPLQSWHGKTWQLSLRETRPSERVSIGWEFCRGRPDDAPIYVFGYGSLMHPSSIARSLPGFDPDGPNCHPARLAGFRKSWSALASHLDEIELVRPGDPPFHVAYLNIEEAEGETALGVVFQASLADLERLDRRETVYVRMDVTRSISLLDPSALSRNAIVFTYVSAPPAQWLRQPAEAVRVREDYLELVQRACDRLARMHPEWGESFHSDREAITHLSRALHPISVPAANSQTRYRV